MLLGTIKEIPPQLRHNMSTIYTSNPSLPTCTLVYVVIQWWSNNSPIEPIYITNIPTIQLFTLYTCCILKTQLLGTHHNYKTAPTYLPPQSHSAQQAPHLVKQPSSYISSPLLILSPHLNLYLSNTISLSLRPPSSLFPLHTLNHPYPTHPSRAAPFPTSSKN